MPDKSRSVRHQRIMDLLDNALETSPEVGFMPVGRPDSCIRCGLAVDADTTWCPACHPTNATPGPADTEWPMARWWEHGGTYSEVAMPVEPEPVPEWWGRVVDRSTTLHPEVIDALNRLRIQAMADSFPSPSRFACHNQPDDGWILP